MTPLFWWCLGAAVLLVIVIAVNMSAVVVPMGSVVVRGSCLSNFFSVIFDLHPDLKPKVHLPLTRTWHFPGDTLHEIPTCVYTCRVLVPPQDDETAIILRYRLNYESRDSVLRFLSACQRLRPSDVFYDADLPTTLATLAAEHLQKRTREDGPPTRLLCRVVASDVHRDMQDALAPFGLTVIDCCWISPNEPTASPTPTSDK